MIMLSNPGWLASPITGKLVKALGGELRFVGGAVRDSLLDRPVRDVDVATPLAPLMVIARLEAHGIKAVPTGIDHGTVTAVVDGVPYEVTTLRRDVETDGRRAKVAFTDDWRSDAARRDFTLNALYADEQGKVFDYFDGVADARAGRVRFIGDADARITEDALRILRFFRFHAHYGQGAIDAAGLEACTARRLSLRGLSRERIRDEVFKLLAAHDPLPTLIVMAEHQILAGVLPELCDLDRLTRLVAAETRSGFSDPLRRLAALAGVGGKVLADLARRLRLANKAVKRLQAMPGPGIDPGVGGQAARALLYRLGRDAFVDRLLLGADGQDLAGLLDAAAHWQRPQLPVSGYDLRDAGVGEGAEIGAALKRLEDAWIASDFRLKRKELLALVKA